MITSLHKNHFDIDSELHGVMHTYRVIYNVILLSQEHRLEKEIIRTGLFSAFIHDMARKHDSYCEHHGRWAVEEKLPLFQKQFLKNGLSENDIEGLKVAVTYHSLPEELSKKHEHYLVTALLKDADALDRIRLSKYGLNPNYLRLWNSSKYIEETEKHFYRTEHLYEPNWDDLRNLVDGNEITRGISID